jgi:hypothetical protein
VVTRTCAVPRGAKFWAFTTLTHERALESNVLNGFNAVFHAEGREHPGLQTWLAPPVTFSGDTLGYSCFFENTTSRTITTGPKLCYDGSPVD